MASNHFTATSTVTLRHDVMQSPMNFRPGRSETVSLAPLNRDPCSHDIDQAIREATFAVDNLDWLQPGDTVLIKPVINSGKPYPSTTSPLAVASMVRLLQEKGAGRVLLSQISGAIAPCGGPLN